MNQPKKLLNANVHLNQNEKDCADKLYLSELNLQIVFKSATKPGSYSTVVIAAPAQIKSYTLKTDCSCKILFTSSYINNVNFAFCFK